MKKQALTEGQLWLALLKRRNWLKHKMITGPTRPIIEEFWALEWALPKLKEMRAREDNGEKNGT